MIDYLNFFKIQNDNITVKNGAKVLVTNVSSPFLEVFQCITLQI